MKKIIEFIKKDWGKTRAIFMLKIAFFLWMVMTVTISIIEKEYILIAWQLYYTVAVFLVFSLQDSISIRRKLTYECLDGWQTSLNTLEESVNRNVELIGLFTKIENTRDYLIIKNDNKEDGILCLGCLKVSYHPEDIKNLYCAECKKFHKKSDEKVQA